MVIYPRSSALGGCVIGAVLSFAACGSSTDGTNGSNGGSGGFRNESGAANAASTSGAGSGQSASGGTPGALANTGGGSNGEPECGLLQFKGDGYILNVLGSGELASLEISNADFKDLAETQEPFGSRWPSVVAPYFNDDFFWHLFVLREHAWTNALTGKNVHKQVAAAGLNIGDPVATKGMLTALLFISDDSQFASATMLHEMTHTWGQNIVPELEGYHWAPVTDVGGLLGGYPRGGVKDLGDGTYETSIPSGRASFAADIEMYMAGLWPKEQVKPFHWLKNAVYLNQKPDQSGSIYSGDEMVTVTIDDVIAAYGPRVPDSSAARHDFRLLPIVVTDVPLTRGDWDFYRWQLAAFQAQTPVPEYDSMHASLFAPPNQRRAGAALAQVNNFRASFHGAATLKTDGLVSSLVAQGECVANLPSASGACARLTARAQGCGIAASDCHIDDEFTNQEASCIADCADQTPCEDLDVAAAGVTGNFYNNAFTWCAVLCQG